MLCSFCRLPRATLECEVCHEDLCRQCVENLTEDAFAMAAVKPEGTEASKYCPRCYDEKVVPALATYNEVLERAKNVHYWPRSYRGYAPVLKKGRITIEVENCVDDADALMKMGFRAAELGFNGLIQGDIYSEKVRDHGYQKMIWKGHAIPAQIDSEKVERDEFNEWRFRNLHHR